MEQKGCDEIRLKRLRQGKGDAGQSFTYSKSRWVRSRGKGSEKGLGLVEEVGELLATSFGPENGWERGVGAETAVPGSGVERAVAKDM